MARSVLMAVGAQKGFPGIGLKEITHDRWLSNLKLELNLLESNRNLLLNMNIQKRGKIDIRSQRNE